VIIGYERSLSFVFEPEAPPYYLAGPHTGFESSS
jgi:hypothetical protein